MAAWLQDLRFGLRLLMRSPGFTLMAIAALAIGIGANTAIFSVINTLMLQPPPYRDPARLAVLWEYKTTGESHNNVVSPGNFIHWREMNKSFDDLSAVSLTARQTITGSGGSNGAVSAGEPEGRCCSSSPRASSICSASRQCWDARSAPRKTCQTAASS